MSDGLGWSKKMRTRASIRTPSFVVTIFTVFTLLLSCVVVPWSGVTTVEAEDIDVERVFLLETPVRYYGGVKTLSPFWMNTANEFLIMRLCMSTLLTYDMDMNLVGDLAESWTVSPDGLTWTFYLVDNAYFIDRADPEGTTHPVTAEDVVYTYEVVQDYHNRLHPYLPGAIDNLPPTILDVTMISQGVVTITLGEPFAPLLRTLTWVPILPRYYWEPREDASGDPSSDRQVLPVGSGPFYYSLDTLPLDPEFGLPLERNCNWHQEANKGWQIHVDRLMLKPWPQLIADENSRWLHLENGYTDCLGISPQLYIWESEPDAYVETYAQYTGQVYELVLNQMSEETREDLVDAGMDQFEFGSNSQLLLDPVIKEAIGMCVDKAYLISDLPNMATPADSPIPPCSEWHYAYGSETGETPLVFDTSAARALLWDYGFRYDEQGNEVGVDSTVTPLCRAGGSDPLRFDLYAVYDPGLITYQSAIAIIWWADEAGMEIQINAVDWSPPDALSVYWYGADFDMILSNSRHSPTSDPSVDILGRFASDAVGSWLNSYLSSEAYDSLFEQSLSTFDPVSRGLIIDEMQRMLYEDMSYQCLAYVKDAYGVSTRYWDGYGDWAASPLLMPHLGFPYLYMQISPDGVYEADRNCAPYISGADAGQGFVGEPIPFSGSAHDDGSDLEFQWYWGDGSKSGWQSTEYATHTYAEDGIYTVYFAAKEVSSADEFVSWHQTIATVYDDSNTPPHSLSFDYVPSSPVNTGETVTFSGSAVDDNGDELFYSWDFGDANTAVGRNVTYQYLEADTYMVTMSVTDNRVSSEPRPVRYSGLVSVTENTPPWIVIPDFLSGVEEDVPYTFTASVVDPDQRDNLRFTWYWGDGSISVTTTQSATHTYTQTGIYEIQGHVDDLTGLPGHNVTDTGNVWVSGPPNGKPSIISFTASNTNPDVGEVITFSGTAQDPDGDALEIIFWFEDDTQVREQTASTSPDTPVTCTLNKSYTTGGYDCCWFYVDDGEFMVGPDVVAIEVVPNDPPLVAPLENTSGSVNEELEFYVDAFDIDIGDSLTITWEFGDGTPLVVGNPVSHAYSSTGVYVFRVYVDDSHTHNVTRAAFATIGTPSWIMVLSPNGGEVWNAGGTYDITWASDGDPAMTVSIDLLNEEGGFNSISNIGSSTDDGIHSWQIPIDQELRSNYYIRVSSVSCEEVRDFSNYSFSIVEGSMINVTCPNGGEEWQAGFIYPITWTSSNAGSNVTIELYFSDSYLLTIADDTENDGYYDWRILSTIASPLLWRIFITDGAANDTSDEPFTILGGPKITLTSPNGGEFWEPGGTYSINWTSENCVFDSVRIELLREGIPGAAGNLDVLIVNETEDDGAYLWTIPFDQPSREDYHMLIFATIDSVPESSFHDWCDDFFTIAAPPSISIISPDGGESWQTGTTHDIRWEHDGIVGDVCIELLRGGSYDSDVANSTENDGVHSWTIPSDLTAADDYSIRISEVSSSVQDFSDDYFSIFGEPRIDVWFPNGGEKWIIGSDYPIFWYSVGMLGDYVRIELYRGLSTTPTLTITPSTLVYDDFCLIIYDWTIPTTLKTGDDYWIRIGSTSTSVYDDSDGYFSLKKSTGGGGGGPPGPKDGSLDAMLESAELSKFRESSPSSSEACGRVLVVPLAATAASSVAANRSD